MIKIIRSSIASLVKVLLLTGGLLEIKFSSRLIFVAEISKNLHDDVVAKQKMIERLINEADEYALHIKESGRMIVKLRKANEEIKDEEMNMELLMFAQKYLMKPLVSKCFSSPYS